MESSRKRGQSFTLRLLSKPAYQKDHGVKEVSAIFSYFRQTEHYKLLQFPLVRYLLYQTLNLLAL